jgi:hypothetical protein
MAALSKVGAWKTVLRGRLGRLGRLWKILDQKKFEIREKAITIHGLTQKRLGILLLARIMENERSRYRPEVRVLHGSTGYRKNSVEGSFPHAGEQL